jgi:anthranilate synthase component 1
MLKKLERDEFERRTADGARTPVFREFLADRETPVSVLTRVADEPGDVFLLESVYNGERKGRYSYLGLGAADSPRGARFFAAPELPSFQGGRVGYFAYESISDFEPRVPRRHEEGTPSSAFVAVDSFLVFDSVRSTVTIAKVAGPGEYDSATAEIASLAERLLSASSIERYVRSHGGAAEKPFLGEFKPEMTKDEFCAIVAKCKDAIRAGEVIQIVPSQKFVAETNLSGLALYRALRLVNPSPYNFFLRVGEKTLVGSSPEELVRLEGGTGSIAPIAGTRPRGATADEDRALEAELLADPKERAEHMMLVDLARNDLGRVSKTGTVRVEGLAHVERYSHVMHLVSNVYGELDPKKADAEGLFRAAFPAGTLTGAPKIRAMELLADFEKSPRGVYGGAAGYFSNTGDMNFAIVIRTMVLERGTLTMRAGAGIVADSDPEREYQETVNKSRAIFEAAKFAKELA